MESIANLSSPYLQYAASGSMPSHRVRALVVEPDRLLRDHIIDVLENHGCDVNACPDFESGRILFDSHDLIVASLDPKNHGLARFVKEIREQSMLTQPFIAGLSQTETISEGTVLHLGINDLLPSPIDRTRFTLRLGEIVHRKRGASVTQAVPLHMPDPEGWTTAAATILLEQREAATAVVDRNMRYLAVNKKWRLEFQLGDILLCGHSHYDLFPDLHPAWRSLYDRCFSGHHERSDDDLLVRPDGTQDWVRWDIQPWPDSRNNTGGLILSCRVVSQDRREEGYTQFEASLARSIMLGSSAPSAVIDLRGRLLRLNESAKLLCDPMGVVENQTFFWNALILPERRETARKRLVILLSMVTTSTEADWPVAGGPALLTHPSGKSIDPVSWTVFPYRDKEGHVAGLILLGLATGPSISQFSALMSDAFTTSSTTASSFSSGNDAFRQIAEAAPFGMIMLGEDAEVIYANPQHRSVLGISIAECGGLSAWLDRACATDDEFKKRLVDEWWERVWRRRAPWTCSLRNVDGLVKEVEFRPAALPDHRLLLTIFDVTDSRLEEQAMRTSEARYRGLFQSCAAGVVILNSSGNITEVNPVFERLSGCSRLEIRRRGLTGFLPDDDITRIRSIASESSVPDGRPIEILTKITARDGTITTVSLSVAIIPNEAGAPVYTACYLHLIPDEEGSSTLPALKGWHGTAISHTVPDLVLLLDDVGIILEHSNARDFDTVLPRRPYAGQKLSEVVPNIAAPLPLDTMMERLSDNPTAETRCEFSTPLVAGGPIRTIEARMVQLGSKTLPVYGLVLHDMTHLAGRVLRGGALPWLRNISLPTLLSNERGRLTGMNLAAESLLGYKTDDLGDCGLYRIFRPDNPRSFSAEISAELNKSRSWKTTGPFFRKDGTHGRAEIELVPVHDEGNGTRGFITTIRPVASIVNVVNTGRPSITLHRARNDLQILSSLTTLQAENLGDDTVQEAVIAGRDRLAAVALIYRQINSEDDTVDFARYASDLGRTLLESRPIASRHLTIDTTFESVHLPQKVAVPLGILLEELITGSLQYSFRGPEPGIIRLSLTTGGGEGVLIVRDNGQLLTEGERAKRLSSFSWHVVEMLSEQISGVLTLLSDLENQVRLRFRIHPDANVS